MPIKWIIITPKDILRKRFDLENDYLEKQS